MRRLHNEELHSLHCSPNIVRLIKSRRLRWAGHVAGKRPLGRHRRIWEDNIRMYLKEIGINIPVIRLIRLGIGIIGEPL